MYSFFEWKTHVGVFDNLFCIYSAFNWQTHKPMSAVEGGVVCEWWWEITINNVVGCWWPYLATPTSETILEGVVKCLHKEIISWQWVKILTLAWGYKDQLRPVRPVFSRSLNFKIHEGPKTGPWLRSLPVLWICGPSAVWSRSGLGFLPVLGPDFQALLIMLSLVLTNTFLRVT
jgi:hypothetical protein